jgi:[acyl-carrier-protein] S-malonyltransferase
MSKTVFLFPGQGSQSVGMGAEFYQEYDFVREIFDMAEETVKMHVSKLCFKGPMEELTQTVNLQPAVTTVNLACLAVLNKEGITYDFCAGHSLGEYSALYAAGIISSEDTIKLVSKRGDLMHRESTKYKGAMHAIVGLPIAEVENLVAAEKGAKAIPLKVSGAWHSDLIKGAEQELKAALAQIGFNTPEKSIIFNVSADISSEADEIKDIMGRQLCSPVKWYDSMIKLIDENMETFVEVGPGRVLAGLLKKILPPDYPAKVYNISNMKQLEKFMNEF